MTATEDPKRSMHRRFVQQVVGGPGLAPAEQRAAAFAGRYDAVGPDAAVSGLLRKTASESYRVTDEDFAAAGEAGFTDDQLFELVICAAIGASTRQYEAGLAALAQATPEPGAR
jgi:hypothetical protein